MANQGSNLTSNIQLPTSKLGVLGGTFDPPHNGHLAIATLAQAQLNLDQILFAPTYYPPHKKIDGITAIDHRLEMVRLAIANNPRFVLSRVDVDRDGPTYTVDTMRLLREQFDAQAQLYFIMGEDSLANLLTWHAPDQLIQLCRLAVFHRPGFVANLDDLENQLPGLRNQIVFLESSPLDISASELQRRLRAHLPIDQFVPPAVATYIAQHNLYH